MLCRAVGWWLQHASVLPVKKADRQEGGSAPKRRKVPVGEEPSHELAFRVSGYVSVWQTKAGWVVVGPLLVCKMCGMCAQMASQPIPFITNTTMRTHPVQAALVYGKDVLNATPEWRSKVIQANWPGLQSLLGHVLNGGVPKWASPYMFHQKVEEAVQHLKDWVGGLPAFDPMMVCTPEFMALPNLAIEPSVADGGHRGQVALQTLGAEHAVPTTDLEAQHLAATQQLAAMQQQQQQWEQEKRGMQQAMDTMQQQVALILQHFGGQVGVGMAPGIVQEQQFCSIDS